MFMASILKKCEHARVSLTDHPEGIDGRFADVYTFRDGRAIQIRSFGERQEAIE